MEAGVGSVEVLVRAILLSLGSRQSGGHFGGPSGFRAKFFFLSTVHIILVSGLPSLVGRPSEHVYARLERAEAFNLLSKSH